LSIINYIPKYTNASSNLIIKNNASGIEIIPIKGNAGIGKIKLIDVDFHIPFI
jgi:hypothetical protein